MIDKTQLVDAKCAQSHLLLLEQLNTEAKITVLTFYWDFKDWLTSKETYWGIKGNLNLPLSAMANKHPHSCTLFPHLEISLSQQTGTSVAFL